MGWGASEMTFRLSPKATEALGMKTTGERESEAGAQLAGLGTGRETHGGAGAERGAQE